VTRDFIWFLIACFAVVTVLGLRHHIIAWANRREAKKLDWHAEQERQVRDPTAHFYMTVEEINAKVAVPEVFERFGRMVWKFDGKNYFSAEEADEARRQYVLMEARRFYQDVDRLRLGRR
jgi:hypothetical protein